VTSFLASAYEGGCPVFSLALTSYHQQCMVVVPIIAAQIEQKSKKIPSWRRFQPPTSKLAVKHVNHWINATSYMSKNSTTEEL